MPGKPASVRSEQAVQAVQAEQAVQVAPDLASVYRMHARQVACWATRLAGPGLDVEDLVHEVFLTVHKLLPRFRGDAKLTTWLYGITVNVVRDRRRKERRRWLRVLLGRDEPERPVPSPADHIEQRQATELVYRVLDGLKERHRTVLMLFELEGLSGEEVAEVLGANIKTVWVWLHRARAEFRKRLADLSQKDEARSLPGACLVPGLPLSSRQR